MMAQHWMLGKSGSFLIFQGIRTCNARKPYIFVIFQGGPDPLPPPAGSAHVFLHQTTCSSWTYTDFSVIFPFDCIGPENSYTNNT